MAGKQMAALGGAVLAAVLMILGLTSEWWLPALVRAAGRNEQAVRELNVYGEFLSYVFFGPLTLVLTALTLFFGRKTGGNHGAAQATTVVTQGPGSVYAGGDVHGHVFAGDNTLSVEMGEDLYESLRSEVAPAPLGVVPPVPEAFVGREGDLEALRRRLRHADTPGNAAPVQVLTALHGWPGVGKTTLVAALAHDGEVRAMFPDGVLFASLGKEPDLLSTIVSWGRAVGAVGLSDAEDVPEASGRLRAAMRDKRVLVVLDDVWEATHALPLAVGGRRCGTLVTTRLDRVARELSPTADGVYRLEVLSEGEALELLGQLAPGVVEDHPDRAGELVRELDRLPLAVRIAGGLLAAEAAADLDVPGLLEELREGRRILEEQAPPSYALLLGEVPLTVAALLRRSTDGLRALYRRRFALLGVLPSRPISFDMPAAQGVWDMRLDPRMTLRALSDRGLIEPAGEGRFQMHSLLSAFAASMIEEDPELPDLWEVQLRRLRHYEVKLGAASEAFTVGGEMQQRWLGIFDADSEGIRAAYQWAASRMEDDDEAASYVSRYASAGARVLGFRLPAREFIRWMESAERAARRLGDEESVATHRANVGTGLLMAGEYAKALPYQEEALAQARASGHVQGEAAALGNLASTCSAMGDNERAIRHAENCVEVARDAGIGWIEAQALGTLGEIYEELGRPREAVRNLRGQRDVARRIGDAPSEARALRKLGKFYRESGHPWRAAVFYDSAARVFEHLGDGETFREVLLGHGILCVQREAYEEALELFRRALRSAEEDDDGSAKAQALMNEGNVQDVLGRPDLAEGLYLDARDTAREGQYPITVGDASWNLAQLLEAQNGSERAKGAARDAVDAYRSAGSPKAGMVEAWLEDRSCG
jgi:tetratricopeptide (TPR) repeat protein